MKAILVIEMPKNCAECKLIYLQGIGEGICNAVDWEERPKWCPLRPIPEKQVNKPNTGGFTRGFTYGWNECIRRNFGETE